MRIEAHDHEGVWLTRARAAGPSSRPPLLFIHGGGHATWCWERHLPFFADQGFECLALDWFNHGRSARLDPEDFLRRSIADVGTEIGIAAGVLGRPPVLVGHSMGGAAAQAYAARQEVAALVLLCPVVPAAIGAAPIEVPVDPTQPWGPPPLEMARHLFFTSLDQQTAEARHRQLCPESPQAVLEASRFILDVDLEAITAPTLVFAGERDVLCPPAAVEPLAAALGADSVLLPGRGHDDPLLHDCWREVAVRTRDWLARLPPA